MEKVTRLCTGSQTITTMQESWVYTASMKTARSYHNLERIIKGFANHRRLEMLDVLKSEPELSVEQIASKLGIGYENASDHLRKMAIAGLIWKQTHGTEVHHKLSPRGQAILVFCKKLE